MINTAYMETIGYPVDYSWVNNFSKNVPYLMKELVEDINSQFEEDVKPFRANKNSAIGYSMNITRIRDWLRKNVNTYKWMKTDKNKLSYSLEAFQRYFNVSHTYNRGNFAHQIIRYLKFKQNLNGFTPKSEKAKNREIFLDFIGSDSRVRSYLNPYGSQSGRFQPKATGFLTLKSAWMRSMIVPPPGRFICAIDYGSQEFLISALLSEDEGMLKAYESGDVYLYTAKLAGAVPWSGTREEYEKERNLFKTVTLGISYQMSCYGLADSLTQALGKETSPDEAQVFIDKFFDAYPKYESYIEKIEDDYLPNKYIQLADGWTMFGDNSNNRSVANMPIQGMGSCIIRKVIDMAIGYGHKIIYPLHDAGYFEGQVEKANELIDTWCYIMREAFGYYFKDSETAKRLIRLDVNIWGEAMPE